MLKKLLFFILLFLAFSNADAQQYTQKDFIGRWRHYYKKPNISLETLLGVDSSQKWVTPGGLILHHDRYIIKAANNTTTFLSIFKEDNNTTTSHESFIQFLNDSTFLRINTKKISEKIDTNNSKILVYHKIKNAEMMVKPHLPIIKDLGNWYSQFKKITDNHIIFTDEQNVTFTYANGTVREATCKVDFTKRPITIDFTYKGTLNTQEDILRFNGDDEIMISRSLGGMRPEHFTTFGDKLLFVREPLAKKLILQGK